MEDFKTNHSWAKTLYIWSWRLPNDSSLVDDEYNLLMKIKSTKPDTSSSRETTLKSLWSEWSLSDSQISSSPYPAQNKQQLNSMSVNIIVSSKNRDRIKQVNHSTPPSLIIIKNFFYMRNNQLGPLYVMLQTSMWKSYILGKVKSKKHKNKGYIFLYIHQQLLIHHMLQASHDKYEIDYIV